MEGLNENPNPIFFPCEDARRRAIIPNNDDSTEQQQQKLDSKYNSVVY